MGGGSDEPLDPSVVEVDLQPDLVVMAGTSSLWSALIDSVVKAGCRLNTNMDDVYGHTIFPEGDVVTLPFSSMSLVDYPMGENLVMDVWSCDGGIQYVATFLKASH